MFHGTGLYQRRLLPVVLAAGAAILAGCATPEGGTRSHGYGSGYYYGDLYPWYAIPGYWYYPYYSPRVYRDHDHTDHHRGDNDDHHHGDHARPPANDRPPHHHWPAQPRAAAPPVTDPATPAPRHERDHRADDMHDHRHSPAAPDPEPLPANQAAPTGWHR
jgi:hypothetical protein